MKLLAFQRRITASTSNLSNSSITNRCHLHDWQWHFSFDGRLEFLSNPSNTFCANGFCHFCVACWKIWCTHTKIKTGFGESAELLIFFISIYWRDTAHADLARCHLENLLMTLKLIISLVTECTISLFYLAMSFHFPSNDFIITMLSYVCHWH